MNVSLTRLAVLAVLCAAAMLRPGAVSAQAEAETRVALVVAAADYEQPLPTAAADGRLMAETFLGLGFAVEVVVDPSEAALEESLSRFRSVAADADVAVVYVASAAVAAAAENGAGGAPLITPIGVSSQDQAAMTPARWFIEAAGAARRLGLVIVDAAAPESVFASAGEALAPSRAPDPAAPAAALGVFISVSRAPGCARAFFGAREGVSPVAQSFADAFARAPEADIRLIFTDVLERANRLGDCRLSIITRSRGGAETFALAP